MQGNHSMTILISGLINIETTLKIDGFPLDYHPSRYPFYGVRSTVSGVGLNIAKALTVLNNDIRFLSLVGDDDASVLVRHNLKQIGVDDTYVLSAVKETAQSVILYDPDGKRAINVDLKDIQETPYPTDTLEQAMDDCSLAVLCNINFSRPMLEMAKQRHMPIATDVHTIADIEDEYNRDFMRHADILFMSDESLPMSPEEWTHNLQDQYGTGIIVIGLGAEGALLAVKAEDHMSRIPALQLRPIQNTIGAGDALFSAFIDSYSKSGDPHEAIRKATIFASYKIGERGAAEGFLTPDHLQTFYDEIYG